MKSQKDNDTLNIPCPHANCDNIIHIKHIPELKKYVEVNGFAYYACDGCAQIVILFIDENDDQLKVKSPGHYWFAHAKRKIIVPPKQIFPKCKLCGRNDYYNDITGLCNCITDKAQYESMIKGDVINIYDYIRELTLINIRPYWSKKQKDCKKFHDTMMHYYYEFHEERIQVTDDNEYKIILEKYETKCFNLFKDHLKIIGKTPDDYFNGTYYNVPTYEHEKLEKGLL